jgi:putative oxidoreductase
MRYTSLQDTALLAVRFAVAAIFFVAAYAKFPLWTAVPEGISATMANLMLFLSIVEPLGALAVLLGFLTRWAAAGLAIIMVGAIGVLQFMMQIGFATPTGTGWNFPLAIFVGCVVLVAFGAGSWSVDKARGRA